MSKTVVDASLILRALQSPNSEAAETLEKIQASAAKEKMPLYAPTLLWTEFANALRFTEVDEGKAKIIYADFSSLPVEPVNLLPGQIEECLTLAYRHKTTVYDTSYHYLALELDGTFFTCDKEYHRQAKSLGHISLVSS